MMVMLIDLGKRYRAYLFPLLLLVVLFCFTVLKISGSSVGVFNTFLYEGKDQHVNTLVNEARGIRSDEWESLTPLTVAQAESNFPLVNKNIGEGQDMSVIADVPYKDWSVIFKPQNLVFFALPVENAFAFKWWLIGIILMLSCYVFSLMLMPKRYLVASLLAVSVFFSPFIQWWYQSINILPLAYGLLLPVLLARIMDKKTVGKKLWLFVLALTYAATCLGILMYVPYLLPIGLVVGAFFVGQLINMWRQEKDLKPLLKRLGLIIGAGMVALGILVTFFLTRKAVISAITNTVYPGHRVEASGHFDLRQLAGGYYNMQLQDLDNALKLPATLNQSEASNFIYLFPFLLPASLYLMSQRRKKQPLDYRILAVTGIAGVFLLRLFAPFTEFIFSALQVNRIPHNRLLIGFGLVNVMLVALIFRQLAEAKERVNKWLTLALTAAAGFGVLAFGLWLRNSYPGYLSSTAKIVLVAVAMGLTVFLALRKQLAWSMAILTGLTLFSTIRVNPLYRGLQPVINSPLSRAMREVGDQQGRWVVSDDVIFENVTAANDLRSLSGVYTYPQLQLWDELRQSPQDQDIYNRYAHVFFVVQPINDPNLPEGARLNPPAFDAFQVNADACSLFLKNHDVAYVFSSQDKSSSPCLTEIKQIVYPKTTFRIYQVKR